MGFDHSADGVTHMDVFAAIHPNLHDPPWTEQFQAMIGERWRMKMIVSQPIFTSIRMKLQNIRVFHYRGCQVPLRTALWLPRGPVEFRNPPMLLRLASMARRENRL